MKDNKDPNAMLVLFMLVAAINALATLQTALRLAGIDNEKGNVTLAVWNMEQDLGAFLRVLRARGNLYDLARLQISEKELAKAWANILERKNK